MRTIMYLVILIVWALSMFPVAERINAWEKVNDYPYGMLCDVYNNCSKQENYHEFTETRTRS